MYSGGSVGGTICEPPAFYANATDRADFSVLYSPSLSALLTYQLPERSWGMLVCTMLYLVCDPSDLSRHPQ